MLLFTTIYGWLLLRMAWSLVVWAVSSWYNAITPLWSPKNYGKTHSSRHSSTITRRNIVSLDPYTLAVYIYMTHLKGAYSRLCGIFHQQIFALLILSFEFPKHVKVDRDSSYGQALDKVNNHFFHRTLFLRKKQKKVPKVSVGFLFGPKRVCGAK